MIKQRPAFWVDDECFATEELAIANEKYKKDEARRAQVENFLRRYGRRFLTLQQLGSFFEVESALKFITQLVMDLTDDNDEVQRRLGL